MAEFICRIGTPTGEIVTRTIEATGEKEARARMLGEGFRVFSVASTEEGLSAVLPFGNSNKKNKVKQGDFLLFNQQLSALLKAGIPVLQAVVLLKNRSASGSMREVLADVEDQIKNGVPLSDAFESQKLFPKIYTASLLAGEKSGALDDVLARYVTYLRRSVGLSRKIRGALAYPIFLLIASVLMVGFLSVYVVPRMSDLFRNINSSGGLPTITLLVLSLSNFVSGNVIWLLPVLIAIGVGIFLWFRTASGRLILDKFLLRLPIAGNLIKQMSTAQVARSMATLLAGGITVVDSWSIASESVTNFELRRRNQNVTPMIREGKTLTESLEKSNWMPDLAMDMIGIGEKSGSLREMLDEVSQFYDAESEVRLEQLTTVLEPLILIVMGGFVVTILLAIYLPIIQAISNGPFTKSAR